MQRLLTDLDAVDQRAGAVQTGAKIKAVLGTELRLTHQLQIIIVQTQGRVCLSGNIGGKFAALPLHNNVRLGILNRNTAAVHISGARLERPDVVKRCGSFFFRDPKLFCTFLRGSVT